MKQLVFLLVVVALAVAAPEPKPKQAAAAAKEEKAQPAKEEKVDVAPSTTAAPAAEEKKPIDDKDKEKDKPRAGLVWPLPDPMCEGDLILHGRHMFDRVRDLYKIKVVEDDVDRMILARGRTLLRRISKFLDETPEFKILSVLCRDSRTLNTSNRWRIEIPKEQPIEQAKAPLARDQPIPKEKQAPAAAPVAQAAQAAPATVEESKDNATISENNTAAAELPRPKEKENDRADSYESRRRDFYKQVGANFAHLLMKEYRKEQMIGEENEYLTRWISDEAVHYGAVGVYCNEGENVKEIKKQLTSFLEEKP